MTPYDIVAQENVRLREQLEDAKTELAMLQRDIRHGRDEQDEILLQDRLGITPQQAAILFALYRAAPRTLGRLDLIEASNGLERDGGEGVAGVQICRIRQRIGPERIETVWGRGFRMSEMGVDLCDRVLAGEPLGINLPAGAGIDLRRKLTDEQCDAIRSAGSRSQAKLIAQPFGVSSATVDAVYYGLRRFGRSRQFGAVS
jgi:hypothetical protein